MDARESRRAAEKRARDLINTRAKAIGDLAVAATARRDADEGTEQARLEGVRLLQQAQDDAAALLTAAHDRVREVETGYAHQYDAALEQGWSTADLRQLGYTPAPRRARRISTNQTTENHTSQPVNGNEPTTPREMPDTGTDQDPNPRTDGADPAGPHTPPVDATHQKTHTYGTPPALPAGNDVPEPSLQAWNQTPTSVSQP